MPRRAAPPPAPHASSRRPASGKGSSRDAPKDKTAGALAGPQKRTFGIGGAIQPRKDVRRFVRWPQYVRLQRQRRVLMDRLKTPPTIAQFTNTADKNTARQVLALANKYKPETRKEKKARLFKAASKSAKGEAAAPGAKPIVVKYGLNHITNLVETKKAKLVIIAHDVDPIELVVWLPTLCRKMGVPYMIIKGKSRLGQIVHKKTATALAFTAVDKADAGTLSTLVDVAMDTFNNNSDVLKTWGGGKLGNKANAVIRLRERALAKEAARTGRA